MAKYNKESTTTNRSFLGNYKTGIGKEDALQKAIYKDLEEGMLSGPFTESELMGDTAKCYYILYGRKSKAPIGSMLEL